MTTKPDISAGSSDTRAAELRGSTGRMAMTLERGEVDRDSRTIALAWASERPVRRLWGNEILDMGARSVDLTRLKDGAPLLVNHDPDRQIGVIESARVDGDRRARAVVRFGRSALAEEILQDVQDGIRTKVSVGYQIDDVVREKTEDGVDTYRVTKWTPFEVSLVSLPADNSVGVGRSLSGPSPKGDPAVAENLNTEQQQQQAPAPATHPVRDILASEATIREQERRAIAKRNADIVALGGKFRHLGGDDLAAKAILDPSLSYDDFREQVLTLVEKRQAAQGQIRHLPDNASGAPNQGGVSFDMGARELIHASNLQAFRGVGVKLGKTDLEVAYRAGMWARAAIYGDPNAVRWCRDSGVQMAQGDPERLGYRTMTEGVFTSAGWLVPVEMESAIIQNREEYGVARRICNVIPMSSSSLTMPRVTSDITAYFVGEGTSGTASDSAGDQVNLNLKDLMAYTNIGKSTAMDTVVPLAEMVAREQARAFAIKEDACLTIGDGTSTYGGMQGLITLLETAAYAGGRATTASGHDTFGEIDNTDLAATIGVLPVYARAGARWLCSGVFEATVLGRLRLAAGGNQNQTLSGRVVESDYAGFPVSIAHNLPASVTTDYTSKVLCVLGNFNLGVAFGSGSGMMMTVDPYTSAHLNLTRIITTERIDINCHGVNKSTTVAGPIVGMYGNS